MIQANSPVYTPVKVTNAEHPRHGQAGSTQGSVDADHTNVKFDSDNAVEAVANADLQQL